MVGWQECCVPGAPEQAQLDCAAADGSLIRSPPTQSGQLRAEKLSTRVRLIRWHLLVVPLSALRCFSLMRKRLTNGPAAALPCGCVLCNSRRSCFLHSFVPCCCVRASRFNSLLNCPCVVFHSVAISAGTVRSAAHTCACTAALRIASCRSTKTVRVSNLKPLSARFSSFVPLLR